MTADLAQSMLRVLSWPAAVPLAHEREAYATAHARRLLLDAAERHAGDVGRALDLKLIERATHAGSCSFCLAHRRGGCPRRREVERGVRSLRRRWVRAMAGLGRL
jgi:hypothetical protein